MSNEYIGKVLAKRVIWNEKALRNWKMSVNRDAISSRNQPERTEKERRWNGIYETTFNVRVETKRKSLLIPRLFEPKDFFKKSGYEWAQMERNFEITMRKWIAIICLASISHDE